MFESDDFDQVLSQFDFDDLPNNPGKPTSTMTHIVCSNSSESLNENCNKSTPLLKDDTKVSNIPRNTQNNYDLKIPSPKHTKRKIINSYFDTQSKRKFPGPAGLLNSSLQDSSTDDFCQMELLSQDLEFSQNLLRREIFESRIWKRLLQDVQSWELGSIDLINDIKQQALAGNLRRRKAKVIAAFVEAIDRSAINPLIILRDLTGNIKCTLHRDAWSSFSPYIASEYCIFILWRPTVLTTGGAFKKHYLNITLSNIFAIYSSMVIKDENDNKPLPDGYNMIYQDEFTVIKTENKHIAICEGNTNNSRITFNNTNSELIDGLDSSLFLDEDF